jgi:K+-sensing histidine kinase KdpD
VAQALCAFARERGVSLIITGHSRRSKLRRLLGATVVDELIAAARTFDVLVAAFDEKNGGATKPTASDSAGAP